MKKITLCTLIPLIFSVNTFSQNTFPSSGSVGIGTTSPNSSSLLDITSTTQGFLTPRMTQSQRNAIASPATGLLIYQTDKTKGFYYYNGSSWAAMKAASTTYTAGQGITITNGVISNLGDLNSSDDITTATAAGGDLVGNFPSPQVAKLQGVSIYPVPPIPGQVLKYNGSYWISSADDTANYVAGTGISILGNTINNVLPDKIVELNSGTGIAISGSYPNFTVSATDSEGANKSLSNLTVTSINQSLIPTLDNSIDMGSSSHGWRDFYFDGSGYLNGISFLKGTEIGNTGVGFNALYSNTSGGGNTANGSNALYFNTTGGGNTASGWSALQFNTDGINNVADGYSALSLNTSGRDNTASGAGASYSNTTGNNNTASGSLASYNITTGNDNTANGYSALSAITTGSNNTAVGSQALTANLTGSNNTAVGYLSTIFGNFSNGSVFGSGAIVTADNQVRIGDASVSSIGGYVNWTNVSDGRVKKNLKENVPGLAFINKLKPITYNLDLDAVDRIMQRSEIKTPSGAVIKPSQQQLDSRKQKEKIVYTGFIAQEVEKSAKELNYDFSGVDAAKNDKDLYGLRYADFVVPLVKAVQELSSQNDSLQNLNTTLQSQLQDQQQVNDAQQNEITSLQSQMQKFESALSQCCTSYQPSSTSSTESDQQSFSDKTSDAPRLEQNVPNPFTQSSYIKFYVPSGFQSAQIIVSDLQGHELKHFEIQSSGFGTLMISGNELSSGTYQYSLFMDGSVISSRQMILTK